MFNSLYYNNNVDEAASLAVPPGSGSRETGLEVGRRGFKRLNYVSLSWEESAAAPSAVGGGLKRGWPS